METLKLMQGQSLKLLLSCLAGTILSGWQVNIYKENVIFVKAVFFSFK